MEDDKLLGHHSLMRRDENVEKVGVLAKKDVFLLLCNSPSTA